jgi:dienelactone hydrolase
MGPPTHPRLRAFLKRLVKTIMVLAAVFVVGLTTMLGLLWQEHRQEFALPAPTGPFPVGLTAYTWVNDALTDELAPSPGVKRTVFVWIWYPSAATEAVPKAEYLPGPWKSALEETSGVLMSDFLTRDLAAVKVNSSENPAVSSEEASYPVVLMRAGGGALTADFTTLAEDLASHGYVVVGFDAPYRTGVVVFPDGHVVTRPREDNPETLGFEDAKRLANKLLPMWTSDAAFVVDRLQRLSEADPSRRFSGRLDLARLGIFGHSFGGATALQFCHDDSRCKAGMDIDGLPFGSVVRDGVKQPFMFLLSDHTADLSTAEGREAAADIQSIYDHLTEGRQLLMIRGANHFSFSDQILLKSSYVIRVLLWLTHGPAPGRGLAITRAYVHTFFDVYLKNAPPDRLDDLSGSFPEIQPFHP